MIYTPFGKLKILLFCSLILVQVNGVFSQTSSPLDKIISVSVKDKNLAEILKVLKSKTGVNFNYKTTILPKTPLDSFVVKDEKLDEVLAKLLTPFKIEFKYFGGKTIILKPVKSKSTQTFTYSGYVFDKNNGEKLVSAIVYCPSLKRGTLTNDYGYFTLTLPNDSIHIEIKYLGYINYREKFYHKSNAFRVITLVPQVDLKEIEILETGALKSEHRNNGHYFNIRGIKAVPALLGEPDILRAVQLVPGVQGTGEGVGGINVRGGGMDQNLVLIDGVPVYNIVHVFGIFSILNPGSVNSVELIKGGFSAKYNGRLSSILDIKLKDGNNQRISGKINVGMLLSSATIEGPLVKNKSSFLVSFRRTYLDAIYQPIKYFTNLNNTNNLTGWYYFYDLNAKLNYKFGLRDKLSINYFMAVDKGRITEKQLFSDTSELFQQRKQTKNLKWSTLMSSARWDRILNDKIFMVTTAGITEYSTKFNDELEWLTDDENDPNNRKINYTQRSGNRDLFGKIAFEINQFKNHQIITGADFNYHRFNTGTLSYTNATIRETFDTSIGERYIFSDEEILYIEDNWKPIKRLAINAGLSFNSIRVKTQRYNLLQPRLSINYAITKNSFVHGTYTKMQQNLQILPNNSVGLPVDIWIPVTDYLKPQISEQYTIGAGLYFKKQYKISVEAYHKSMQNLVELKEGAFFTFGGYEWDKSFYTGSGIAKGIEFILEKQIGRYRGWIGYALSKSDRTFPDINSGLSFPFKYDRRHQITTFIKFPRFKKYWDFSMSWIFTTGSPVTLPSSVYILNGNTYYEFTQRNTVRMSNYHRMDISFTKTVKKPKHTHIWNFGAYNAYSHLNPLFISTGIVESNSDPKLKFFEVGILPIIPFVSYEYSF